MTERSQGAPPAGIICTEPAGAGVHHVRTRLSRDAAAASLGRTRLAGTAPQPQPEPVPDRLRRGTQRQMMGRPPLCTRETEGSKFLIRSERNSNRALSGSGRLWCCPRVHWVRPELVVEVTYLTWANDGLLRQVVYEGLQEDKPARHVARPLAATETAAAGCLALGMTEMMLRLRQDHPAS
jgi:hypothetical protein